jgi:glucosamine--fructose-6-phosphate aminotransferase (isomerizing)
MTTSERSYGESHTWKEILSQGLVWQSVITDMRGNHLLEDILAASNNRRKWIFVGCGTSFYLAEAAAVSWTLLTGHPARAVPASEVLLFPELIRVDGPDVQMVVISRSGRTSEAVRAARALKRELQLPTVGITCAENSDLERACDLTITLRAADEQSTVMTRSFTSMLMTLQVLAARRAGNVAFVERLLAMAEWIEPRIAPLAQQMEAFVAQHTFNDYVFLGQGPFHGLAREAALKVMEMSCSYSQFFHTLEFRHGPKAIVGPNTLLTFFLSETGQKAEAEMLGEMKDLGGVICSICGSANREEVVRSSDLVIEFDAADNELALLAAYIVPCQLLGFFTGLKKGLNPDAPKNLTRVVILD